MRRADRVLGPWFADSRPTCVPCALGGQGLAFRDSAREFRVLGLRVGVSGFGITYSLHCSSFFWFNQIYNKDPIR